MPLITFSHPDHKIKTVYAAAGSHTETVLTIAKANVAVQNPYRGKVAKG